MPTPISKTTKFTDIYSDFSSSGKNDRHIRGGVKDGGKSLYIHNKVSIGFTASRRTAREAKRAQGAQEIRNAIVNEFGADVADKVLSSVAGQTKHDLNQGITVGDLKKIRTAIQELIPSDEKAVQKQKLLRQSSEDVSSTLAQWGWDRSVPTADDNDVLGKAGEAYRALDEPQRRFVAMRLMQQVRNEVTANGEPIGDAELAKMTRKLIEIAQSEYFKELDKGWADAGAVARNIIGHARNGGKQAVAAIIKSVPNLTAKAAPLPSLENMARGKTDQIMNPIGSDDRMSYLEQSFDQQLGGLSPADANAAYRRAMGSHGACRAILFAHTLAGQVLPIDAARKYHDNLEGIQVAAQTTARSLAVRGREDAGADLKAISNALVDAVDEHLTSKGYKGQQFRIKQMQILDDIADHGPFAPQNQEILELAMAKAGVADPSAVKEAYDSILTQVGIDKLLDDEDFGREISDGYVSDVEMEE
ncbi:MAG: hypothetical protein GY947_00045 [Rhodobacteraceae bacterium]|nr:hypothetical protein [Paracoccaceae bacterium]